MAYKCGYEGGYGEDTCVFNSVFCGGGYGGMQYAGFTYAGAVPCIGIGDTSTPVDSSVEEFCRPDGCQVTFSGETASGSGLLGG